VNLLARLFYAIWKTWFMLQMVIFLIITYPMVWYGTTKRSRHKWVFLQQRAYSRYICWLSGIFSKIHHEKRLQQVPQKVLYISNHTSYLDIALSYHFVPHFFLFMAKIELLKIPLFRRFFHNYTITVNRKSRNDAYDALKKAGYELDLGNGVFIFPEGTISSNGVPKPFKNGVFKLAIEKQVDIQPIVYLNNWKLLQNGGWLKSYGRPGIAHVIIHEKISTVGMKEEDYVILRDKFRFLLEDTLANPSKYKEK
jgi:1-acyl-sn-glycerol-3-phosphate acyltransferase